jgi:signal peptidase I
MRRRRIGYSSGLDFYEDKGGVNMDIVREVVSWIVTTALAVLLAVFWVRAFGFRAAAGDAGMKPAIVKSQNVFVNTLSYRFSSPKRGDVAAFYAGGSKETAPIIRRIVAVPGDTVQIEKGVLLINGTPGYKDKFNSIKEAGLASKEITLGSDEYFVMSDNTANTDDSRSPTIGTVKSSYLIGRVWLALPSTGGSLHLISRHN